VAQYVLVRLTIGLTGVSANPSKYSF